MIHVSVASAGCTRGLRCRAEEGLPSDRHFSDDPPISLSRAGVQPALTRQSSPAAPSDRSETSFRYLKTGPSRPGLNFTNPYPHAPGHSSTRHGSDEADVCALVRSARCVAAACFGFSRSLTYVCLGRATCSYFLI